MTGPVDESKNQLPDILCVIQVCIFSINHPIFLLHFSHMACLIGFHDGVWLICFVRTCFVQLMIFFWFISHCLIMMGEIVDLFLVMWPIMKLQAHNILWKPWESYIDIDIIYRFRHYLYIGLELECLKLGSLCLILMLDSAYHFFNQICEVAVYAWVLIYASALSCHSKFVLEH